ncbi:MAG: haloacid dehalogenase-like hydrolase [Myxococcales bacterium]|nr:haloacid dehalogenase-like hydrolase [Myxococcales bacterium]MCB9731021.1 haloacid dehalogenase-like hydrolase [Deltaproteobacteria bacterium]
MSDRPAAAAFFRVEGALLRPTAMSAPAYFALNTQAVKSRLTRLGGVAIASGMRLAGSLGEQAVVQKLAWMGLRGMGHDRLAVLGDEYYHRFVLPNLKSVGLDLVARARKDGLRVVLLSELLDVVVAPLRDHVGADELLCNRLEMRDDEATGRLLDPVVGGPVSGQWARTFAAERGLDLARSQGFGARGVDGLLLSAVGLPCAVDPDPRLRRMAKDLDWPVVQSGTR